MKKFSFFALAMAGMLFTACSSDNDAVAEGGSTPETLTEGFLSLSINLPTTPSTRAANDNFDDGDAKEYNVQDCAVLLFEGAEGENEEEATLLNAQPLAMNKFDKENEDDNVTTTLQAIAKVKNRTSGKKLYALAVLNYRNLMTIDNEGLPTIADTKLTTSTTLADIRELTTNIDLMTRNGEKNYFFMTNAVLSKVGGGVATTAPEAKDIFQLAEVTNNAIYESESAAINGEACVEIFVERAVAKATLRLKNGLAAIEPFGQEPLAIDPDKTTWAIDNMEPNTFILRNPGNDYDENKLDYIGYSSAAFTTANYRFVGHLSTKYNGNANVDNDFYRTYWCVDPQYSDVAQNMIGAKAFSSVGDNSPLYCYENTFDVDNQMYKNTTRAIIKVVLKDQKNFFTVNGGSTIYTKEDAISYIEEYIINMTEVKAAFNKMLTSGASYTITPESFEIEYERSDVSGQYKVIALTVDPTVITVDAGFKANAAATINGDLAKLIDSINKGIVVSEYQNGEVYYAARFKHFAGSGDAATVDLAPWNTKAGWETPAPTAGDIDNIYPASDNRDRNYLGRYGMVRNNWYDVEILSFVKLGYPADPSGKVNNEDFDDPNTPDDNIDEYIKTKIHVLSWAKRVQQWSF